MSRLSELGAAHLADNVVVLQYLQSESSIDRTLTVLKTRASSRDPAVRRFEITRDGIHIAGDSRQGSGSEALKVARVTLTSRLEAGRSVGPRVTRYA